MPMILPTGQLSARLPIYINPALHSAESHVATLVHHLHTHPPTMCAFATAAPSSGRRIRPRAVPAMCVQRVENPSQFSAALPAATARNLVVFSFISQNCRACTYASNAYARLAVEFEHLRDRVTFCEMDVTQRQNHHLCQQLGVLAVPAVHFYTYRGDCDQGQVGVLDQFVGPRNTNKIRDRVSEYSSDEFRVEDYVFEDA